MAAPSRRERRGPTRSGSSSGAYIVGLKELQKELRAISTDDAKWNRELGKANRVIARRARDDARATARSMGGPQKHFERAILGRATATEVRLQISDGNAYSAFWGAKQDKTGWNAGNSGRPNQPQWVGNSWDVGVRGQGPYALNESIADNLDSYLDDMWSAVDRITAEAFPDGRL